MFIGRRSDLFARDEQARSRQSGAALCVVPRTRPSVSTSSRRICRTNGKNRSCRGSRDEAEVASGRLPPGHNRHEEEADAIALEILVQQLSAAPYREPVFSERGSLYWNIDLLALASDAWQNASIEREAASTSLLHPAFEPTEFPTPPKTIEANARKFVCDLMTRRRGVLLYPGKSISHPPVEQRLRRIAEKLAPIAASLPATGAQDDFKPIARLQQDVSPILTHIYRETGVYLEAVQSDICANVNAMEPQTACR